jgi:hypothetical protein
MAEKRLENVVKHGARETAWWMFWLVTGKLVS